MVRIPIDRDKIADFCRKHCIRRLSFFGSVLRDDFTRESDVDVLVEFQAGNTPGLFGLSAMEREMTVLLGRRADLNTAGFLSSRYRDEVLREAEQLYVAA